MTIFSQLQGTPQTVYALLRTLEALGEHVHKDTLSDWLTPGPHASQSSSRITNTLACAKSLGWVDESDGLVSLKLKQVPSNAPDYGDLIYRTLRDTEVDDNRALLGVYAVMVLRCQIDENPEQVINWTNKQWVDYVSPRLESAFPGVTFNTTRTAPLKRWLAFAGLLWNQLKLDPLPDMTNRVERELNPILISLGKQPNEEIAPSIFFEALKERMPFIVGGKLFEQIAEGDAEYKPNLGATGWLVSHALRELEQDQKLRLSERGDPIDPLILPKTPIHLMPKTISGITIWPSIQATNDEETS